MINKVNEIEQQLQDASNAEFTTSSQTIAKPRVSGSLLQPPIEIWVNVYNPIKPNSWDIHSTENGAVINSIGAPTHCYKHESVVNNILSEIHRRQLLIKSEPDGIVRETMINNLLLDI
jgi:hypothetical protein